MTTEPGVQAPPTDPPPGARTLLSLAAVGAAVSLSLGVYGRLHTPTGVAVGVAGFSGPQAVKAWLTTGATVLAVLQVLSAAVMYGRVPRLSPGRFWATAHRWSGRVAFLLAVPVALHCLYALGLQTYDTRVLVHSVAGCAFFGAFTVKMLALTRRGLAGWVVPVLGATVFSGLVVLWLTASLWFFTTAGVHL